MISNLTLAELREVTAAFADASNSCVCSFTMAGVLAPCLPGGDDAHPFVEMCITCELFPDDDAAAQAVARVLGLNVRRRYDDDSLRYWRPFLARPGSPDDRDTYCVGADAFGCWPQTEIPITPK